MKTAGGGKIINIGSMMSIFGAASRRPMARARAASCSSPAPAPRLGQGQHPGQRRPAGLDRHRPDQARPRGDRGPERAGAGAHARGRWGSPTTSPASRCSSRARRPTSSPARRFRSTAAIPLWDRRRPVRTPLNAPTQTAQAHEGSQRPAEPPKSLEIPVFCRLESRKAAAGWSVSWRQCQKSCHCGVQVTAFAAFLNYYCDQNSIARVTRSYWGIYK